MPLPIPALLACVALTQTVPESIPGPTGAAIGAECALCTGHDTFDPAGSVRRRIDARDLFADPTLLTTDPDGLAL